MIGVIIGSGIFATPTSIAAQLQNPWLILALWVIGGVVAFCGAMTSAELATMFPQSGGAYVFVREGYGRAAAFVFGWTYMLIIKPSAAGGIALIFGSNINQLLTMMLTPEWAGRLNLPWDERFPTIAMLVLFTVINVRGVSLSTSVATVFSTLKVAALLAIIGFGAVSGLGSWANFHGPPAADTGGLLTAIVPVLALIAWTYDGWSDVGSIAGEVRDPQRELPRIYLAGTAGITLIYVAVNAVYIALIPLPEMAQVKSVAPVVMQMMLGASGALAVVLVVLVSTSGSTHGSIMTGARVTFQQARDGLLFEPLGRVHPRFGTPHVALWVQLGLSCLATWYLKTFDALANSFVFTMWIFYALAGSTLFIFRIKRPDAPRPFRCWGYPVVPAVFVLSAVAMTVLLIRERPGETLPYLGILLAGLPVYFVWERWRRRSPAAAAR